MLDEEKYYQSLGKWLERNIKYIHIDEEIVNDFKPDDEKSKQRFHDLLEATKK